MFPSYKYNNMLFDSVALILTKKLVRTQSSTAVGFPCGQPIYWLSLDALVDHYIR
jgi:hypothetical protein